MQRRTRRKLKNQLKYFLPLLVFVFLSVVASLWYVSSINKETNESKVLDATIAQKYKYDRYYAAVTGYTNSTENISFNNLKKAELLVSKEDRENIAKILDENKDSQNLTSTNDLIGSVVNNKTQIAIVPFEKVDFRVKTLSIDGKYLWDKNTQNYPLKLSVQTKNMNEYLNRFSPSKVTLLTNVGDVILGRHVAYKMKTYNDYTHPWLKMADLIKKGDITFADLETPLSDRVAPPDEGMSFITPSKAIDGLKLAGVDVVALANNHSTNYGVNPFLDTLKTLSDAGIKYVGGGEDWDEAYKTLYYEKNGLKFAFLDYNSIIGAMNATEDSPGIAKFDIKPWADVDSEQDINRIKNAVAAAKKQADVVVLQLHWGVEYKPDPIESQVDVAHAAIDSGADLIIGTHPHVVAGMENYKNVPVFYSLGNFIFDQEWSTETKQGTVAETYFYGKRLVAAPLIPYQIEDYNQPQLATSGQKTEIFDRIFGASLSPEFKK